MKTYHFILLFVNISYCIEFDHEELCKNEVIGLVSNATEEIIAASKCNTHTYFYEINLENAFNHVVLKDENGTEYHSLANCYEEIWIYYGKGGSQIESLQDCCRFSGKHLEECTCDGLDLQIQYPKRDGLKNFVLDITEPDGIDERFAKNLVFITFANQIVNFSLSNSGIANLPVVVSDVGNCFPLKLFKTEDYLIVGVSVGSTIFVISVSLAFFVCICREELQYFWWCVRLRNKSRMASILHSDKKRRLSQNPRASTSSGP